MDYAPRGLLGLTTTSAVYTVIVFVRYVEVVVDVILRDVQHVEPVEIASVRTVNPYGQDKLVAVPTESRGLVVILC